MSVDLFVRFKRDVGVGELEASASSALRQLLNLQNEVTVRVALDEPDDAASRPMAMLTSRVKRMTCSLPGHEVAVYGVFFINPVRTVASDGSSSYSDRDYLSIGCQSQRTPLCWALVGAVAVGMARVQDSEIEDTAGYFTKAEIISPEAFCNSLRVPFPHSETESAAAELYARMTKSAEVAAWVKSQLPM